MIVVIGQPHLHGSGADARAGGLAAGIARAASAAAATVELIGKIGDDPAGDALQIGLARDGVGHVAMQRDPSRPTVRRRHTTADAPLDAAGSGAHVGDEDVDGQDVDDDGGPPTVTEQELPGPELDAADVALALRYLTDYRVVVVAFPTTSAVTTEAAAAATWAGAHLVVIVRPDDAAPTGLPADAVVMAMTPDDGEDLGGLIGGYAAAVDAGADPATAFETVRTLAAAEPVPEP